MNAFLNLLRRRRSVRRYQGRPLRQADLLLLQEAVLRAPSSRGRDPWEFVFVTDRALLKALAAAKPEGSSFLAGAALGIVICGDPRRADTWVEDCSIASLLAHLTAASLGLGSCWIQIHRRPHDAATSAETYVRRILGIPSRLRVLSIVAVGWPAARPKAPSPRRPAWDRIHQERYGG